MVDHIKPVIRDGANGIPSDKDAKSILDLAMSAKSPTSIVSISNIITKKDKHEHKSQEVNNHLTGMCTNKKYTL